MKLTSAEINKLDNYIQTANKSQEDLRDICWSEGYLCAICSSPELIMPGQWMKNIHNEGFEFNSEKEANEVMSLLMRLYNNTIKALDSKSYQPVYQWHKFKNETKLDLAIRWSKGYKFGTMMASSEFIMDEHMLAIIFPILTVSGTISEKELKKENISKEQLVEQIPLAVELLNDIFTDLRKDSLPTHNNKTIINDNKIGRNDLCYCGSGKKYKKCCIARISNDNIENIIQDPELLN